MKTTNSIKHNIETKDKNGNSMYIKIRLNDECKNGHQDFSITCDIYKKEKPKTDRYFITGGCCHDDILEAMPELKIFVNLHLCDYKGIPMYAVENGFYHLTNGFNKTKPEEQTFNSEFCEYYRITPKQFETLKTSTNKLQYALNLQNLGILKQWEEEASKAIEILENWTDTKFLVDSVRTQFNAPTEAEIKEEEQKQLSGYYTPQAEQEREKEKVNTLIAKLELDRDINKANTEFEVKKQVLLIGGEKALNNCIFYNHSNTLAFNWKSYDNISTELINKISKNIILPEGCSIENKNN